MQDKRQCYPTAVRFPGAATTFKVVSSSKITTSVPGVANQRYGNGDDLKRYKGRQQRGVPDSVQTGAIEMSAVEIRDVTSRRLLAPPFGLFLRAAMLAHLERTFR
jgi:hypothetical protein